MAKRPLTRKDLKLWKKVTETVQPLEGKTEELKALIHNIEEKLSIPIEGNQPDPDYPVQRKRASSEELAALKETGFSGAPRTKSGTLPLQHQIDRKEKRRILKGRSMIDARLDLHGMRQQEAHVALFGFLRSCHLQGHKHVLVITGKGSRGEPDHHGAGDGKGVLRRVVPKWLAEPDIRNIIVGFEEAHRSLGGTGALHIRLRSRNKMGR